MSDLTQSCQDDVQRKANSQKKLSVDELREAYCHRCRNGNCDYSLGKGDKFSLRISTQLDRLSNPVIVDVNDRRYESIPDWRDVPPNFEWDPSVVFRNPVREVVGETVQNSADEFTPIDGVEDVDTTPSIVKPVAPIQRLRPQSMPSKGNTRQDRNGLMLDGIKPTAVVPKDEWASNTTAPPVKVKRGARIQFTEDGQAVLKKG